MKQTGWREWWIVMPITRGNRCRSWPIHSAAGEIDCCGGESGAALWLAAGDGTRIRLLSYQGVCCVKLLILIRSCHHRIILFRRVTARCYQNVVKNDV